MSHRQYEDGVVAVLDAVQGDIAGTPARDDQFAQAVLDWAADQWMVPKRFDSVSDEINGLTRCDGIARKKKISQPSARLPRRVP